MFLWALHVSCFVPSSLYVSPLDHCPVGPHCIAITWIMLSSCHSSSLGGQEHSSQLISPSCPRSTTGSCMCLVPIFSPLRLYRAGGKSVISGFVMHHHSSSSALGLYVIRSAVPGWCAVLQQRTWSLVGLDAQRHVAGWGAAS